MIVLDTNVISEFSRQTPDQNVRDWLRRVEPDLIATCAPVVSEFIFGAEWKYLKTGSPALLNAYQRFLSEIMSDRVFPFDAECAQVCGKMMAREADRGRTRPPMDMMIASICLVNGLELATRNIRDFADLDLTVINPFEEL